MERLVGAGVKRKLLMATQEYKGSAKPAMPLKSYKDVIKMFKKKENKGGAKPEDEENPIGSGTTSSWFTPWKWDAEDWKNVGVGIAYGADAVIVGALDSKTVRALIKSAVSHGTSAQLASMGILLPPTLIAMGSDVAIDAFISGIVMAHDYIVGDNPYRKQVDELFEYADKFVPQIIKGIDVASDLLTSGITNPLLSPDALKDLDPLLGGSKFSESARRVMIKMEQAKRIEILDNMHDELEARYAYYDELDGLEQFILDTDWNNYENLVEIHQSLTKKGKGVEEAITISKKDFKNDQIYL